MKKTALAIMLILAVAGTFVVRLGKANPIRPPGTGYALHPIIQIDSPINKTYSGLVLLNFSILPPENWLTDLERVDSFAYWVDWRFRELVNVSNSLSVPFNYSTFLENLTDGNHELRIVVDSTGWVRNPVSDEISDPTSLSTFATAYFTVDNTPPGSSPSPTSTPTPSAAPEAASESATFPATLLFVASVGIAVVGTGLSVYFKKFRRNKDP